MLALVFRESNKGGERREREREEKYIIRSVAGKKVDTSETLDERSL